MLLTKSACATKIISISPYFRSWVFLSRTTTVVSRNAMLGLLFHVNTQKVLMFPYILDTHDVFHIWHVSYILYHTYDTTTAATVLEVTLQSVAAYCYFLLLSYVCTILGLARARFASWYSFFIKHFYIRIWCGHFFLYVGYLASFSVLCFPVTSRVNKRNDSSSVTASGRYRRGLRNIYHRAAVLSDGWVMVLLLHQVCIQRDD